jgi:hypothetical protein
MLRGLRKSRQSPFDAPEPGFPLVKGTHYLHVFADIVQASKADWYLEIGSRTGDSLARIQCNFVAIDPEFNPSNPVFQAATQIHFFQMTSDAFFDGEHLAQLCVTPQVAFIDGMHHFEFALRDFMNCEAAMAPDGTIILHDVCPATKVMATRDMAELNGGRAWTGDVWKVVAALIDHRPDLDVSVLDAQKTGLCVVRGLDPNNRTLKDNMDAIIAEYIDQDLDEDKARAYYGRFELVDAKGFAARTYS